MESLPDAQNGRETVKLKAIFVPDGQTVPAELLAGMMDVARLTVQFEPNSGPNSEGLPGASTPKAAS